MKAYTNMFIAALFIVTKKLETTQSPSTGELLLFPYNRLLPNNDYKQTTDTHIKMDESQNYY